MAKRELVFRLTAKDFEWQYFRAGGKGGQNQNKRDTGCRVIHRDSGAVAESREHRTQPENRRAAFIKLGNSKKFQTWAKIKAAKMPPIEAIVDEQMRPVNLQVEVVKDGKWVPQSQAR